MENAKLEEIKEIVKNLQTHYDFNDYVLNFIDEEELKACEDTSEIIALFEKANEDREITDTEVIYYASAMEYLSENDNSLTESLGIASEYGFECGKLNSETLASILKSRNNEEDYQEFLKELEKEIDDLV